MNERIANARDRSVELTNDRSLTREDSVRD
jgi:hypothetical protein